MHPCTTIVDLSHPLREPVPCYPGDPEFKLSLACCFPLAAFGETDDDDPAPVVRVSTLSLGTHTGTHVDAPFHFFPSGQKLHEIPLARFVGRAVVLDVRPLARARAEICWADVARTRTIGDSLAHIGPRAEGKADIVLLWTGWDVHWGTPAYFSHPYFAGDVARALCDLGVQLVGVDMLSPDETPSEEGEGEGEGAQTATGRRDKWAMHETLLGRGVLICENLRGLEEVVGGAGGDEETWVSLVPLSVHDADGAPVRAYGWTQPRALAGRQDRHP